MQLLTGRLYDNDEMILILQESLKKFRREITWKFVSVKCAYSRDANNTLIEILC